MHDELRVADVHLRLRVGLASRPPTYWESWMLVRWKLLSERLVPTLKLAAFSMSSRRYSMASFCDGASSFSAGGGAESATTPKVLRAFQRRRPCPQSRSSGST